MNSTMSSTLYPASSKFTVPSTQNTAPVLLYSCLYTHDLKRKAKRWQDGVLKYHTFNKRIMVYDVPRNFVGDTYWREPQAIQDCDELELEKGVLVQVGEELTAERTQTDLTELLGKRKPKPTCDGPQVPLAPVVRTPSTPQSSSIANAIPETSTSVASSQLRPKTLNALLGKPKGPVGRATIPLKSPAEQRRGKENSPLDGVRSSKRRRIEHPTDSSPIDSGPNRTPAGAMPGRSKGATTSKSTSEITRSSGARKSEISREAPLASAHHDLAILRPTSAVTSRKLQEPRIDQATNRLDSEDLQDERRPENHLRIVSSKPRRKLMYRDLLPRKASPQHIVQSANGQIPIDRASNRTLSKSPDTSAESSSLSAFHQAQQERLDARLSKRKKPVEIVEDDAAEKQPGPISHPENPPDQRHSREDTLTSTQAQRTLTEMDSILLRPHPTVPPDPVPSPPELHFHKEEITHHRPSLLEPREMDSKLLRHPTVPPDPVQQSPPKLPPREEETPNHRPPPPEPRTETIKAAMPPHRPISRPFQRSLSDLTTAAKPPTNPKRTHSGLLKSFSNDFTPIRPPPPRLKIPPIHIHSTNLYAAPLENNKDAESIPDSRPGSAKEQAVEPWGREAFDLFGFDGTEKRVGTDNGVGDGKQGGGGMVRGEDGWLVASQGFV
ncbi:MAG: hypothetical protein L6R36_002168 [Xanthoria steineri]|nr:MAG: hypothetical protein L6R36_002168 [Xanthoria steineri]